YLVAVGIELREVRVVPDVEAEIIGAVNALRGRYTYLFTTGGIGPTHDDITAESVAKALGLDLIEDPRAIALLLERLKPEDLNEARRRMARLPIGAELVQNSVSKAPGFKVDNVIVMAGVPRIMQAMLDDVMPRLETGAKMLMETIDATGVPEGAYAAGLAAIAEAHPRLSMGSYPSLGEGRFRNEIVVRGKEPAEIAAAIAKVYAMLERLREERAATRHESR
ncbi:MAG TPA: molybdopterin-binding protein, partial [Beijerinckiaceae bacterium]|nr:molybdopterin-binding protein [Beijerinckiaceae bacterium]